MTSDLRASAIREIDLGSGKPLRYFSLPALARAGFPGISRLPISLRKPTNWSTTILLTLSIGTRTSARNCSLSYFNQMSRML